MLRQLKPSLCTVHLESPVTSAAPRFPDFFKFIFLWRCTQISQNTLTPLHEMRIHPCFSHTDPLPENEVLNNKQEADQFDTVMVGQLKTDKPRNL